MKLIILLITSITTLSAQSANAVFSDNVPLNASATTNFPCTECSGGSTQLIFGPVTSIAQGYHQFNVVVSAQAGHTCLNPSAGNTTPLFLEVVASYSPNVGVGSQIVVVPGTTYVTGSGGALLSMYVQAIGAFPYVYLRIGNNNSTVSCKYVAQYSGTLYPITPINQYQLTQNISLVTAAGGDTLLVGPSAVAGVAYNIVQLTLNNKTNNQTVQFFCGGGAGTLMGQFDNLIAGQTIVIPYSSLGVMKTCPSINATGVTITLTNATEVTVNAQVAFTANPIYTLP